MSIQILPPTTAGIHPEKFTDDLIFSRNRTVAAVLLGVFLIVGFALRVHDLGAESLGEDELNKLQTAEEYRQNGLSGKNGEHPFLMKGLQTLSISASERLNAASGSPIVSDEAALRFPVAVFGTFTSLLLFLLVSQLFGRSIGLVTAALWAVEPMAIGFDRIAKEDSLVLFFFTLMLWFWVRGQTAVERGNAKGIWNAWAAAASFAALMASKYYPFLLSIPAAYYGTFLRIEDRKWDMGKRRYLIFLTIMALVFVILNPTILLPETWREMLKFSSENRVGHDSYEFMGTLYSHKMTDWLSGIPWTFYYVLIGVKTSLSTFVFFLIGLPLLFRRKMGDGRFLLFFWAFLWFFPFSIAGGKFTRYFTVVLPLVLIAAATGICFLAGWVSDRWKRRRAPSAAFQVVLFGAGILVPLVNSVNVSPNFRMFTNTLGGGMAAAGSYFPHDEFYDAETRDVVAAIAREARPGAVTACESPGLFSYYAGKIGRGDLVFVSLSDKNAVVSLSEGDLVVLSEGRRYFSNDAYEKALTEQATPSEIIQVAGITAARVFKVDERVKAILAISAEAGA